MVLISQPILMRRHCEVSIVITVDEAYPNLAECLRSLARQTMQNFEIVVSKDARPNSLGPAIQSATGEVVIVTDTRCRFPAEWLERVVRAQRTGALVIGGAVEYDGPGTLSSWATYFADYGAFMPGTRRKVTHLLAGNHVCYRSTLIRDSADLLREGYRKTFFHRGLLERFGPFLFDPELTVVCVQCKGARTFAADYYRKARGFARARAARWSQSARLLRIAAAPFVALLLLFRRWVPVWKIHEHRRKLLTATPLLAFFVACWTVGEVAGYCLGPEPVSTAPEV